MLNEYPMFKRNEVETYFKGLKKAEQEAIKDYLEYRKGRGAGEGKLKDIRRYILHIRFIIDKDFKEIDLKNLRSLLAVVSGSRLSEGVKNNLKIDLRNFMKYFFKDWRTDFNELEDIKTTSDIRNEKKINSKNLFSKEEIEKLIKHEPKLFWKAFLLVQYEGGLRTIETRTLKWEDLNLNSDGEITEINIFATKTKRARVIFVEKATFYLNKLREEQENLEDRGDYIFHSPKDKNKPVGKGNISMWFRSLVKKTLGREGWNYLLRHSRATELYKLAKENKISKDTAIKFMGHSKDMSETYTHLDDEDVKKMLKEQVYKLEELPPEKKAELQKQIDDLKKQNESMLKMFDEHTKIINEKYRIKMFEENKKLAKKYLK